MNIFKSLSSILFEEGISNFVKRKRNKTFLDNRVLHNIHYNNKIAKIFLNKKFGYVDQYIFAEGIYEKNIIDEIREVLFPEKVLLDIGSNIGQHSLILAPYCKKIFAFEPIPEIYQEFQNSIEANHYKNVFLTNTAIGNKKETKSFHFNISNAGASSFIENDRASKLLQVNINILEDVLPKNQNFEVVKMDVEGYEAVVILGNKEIFLKNRPIFFLEFSPNCINKEGSHSANELIDFFFENNFEIFAHSSQKTFTEFTLELLKIDNWIVSPIKK